MITPRHAYSDTDPETATRTPDVAPAAPAVAPNATSRQGLALMWVSVALFGAAGMVAGYLRQHHIGGWNVEVCVLGVGLVQFVVTMAWYVRADFPPRAAEPAARPSPHPRPRG